MWLPLAAGGAEEVVGGGLDEDSQKAQTSDYKISKY